MTAQGQAALRADAPNPGTRSNFRLRLLLLLASFASFAAGVWLLGKLLIPKYQGTVIEGNFTEEYYRDPTQHDLLIIGSCESYENISPMQLWRQYGITSYIRGNANQLLPQSFAVLMDALERETPRAVILNIMSLTIESQTREEYNRMVFDSLPWSIYKLEGIRETAMEGEHLAEYIFPILRYHARWQELDAADFRYAFGEKPLTSFQGYYLRADVRPAGEFPKERRKNSYEFPQRNVLYLDKIREECENRGIQLILMKAPSLYPAWEEPYEAQVREYAKRYGLPYYNFLELSDEAGLDMSRDTYDEGLHLNVYGAEKVADYMGKELIDRFGFPDHRGEPELDAYYGERLAAYDAEKQSQEEDFSEYGYIRRFTEALE